MKHSHTSYYFASENKNYKFSLGQYLIGIALSKVSFKGAFTNLNGIYQKVPSNVIHNFVEISKNKILHMYNIFRHNLLINIHIFTLKQIKIHLKNTHLYRILY